MIILRGNKLEYDNDMMIWDVSRDDVYVSSIAEEDDIFTYMEDHVYEWYFDSPPRNEPQEVELYINTKITTMVVIQEDFQIVPQFLYFGLIKHGV